MNWSRVALGALWAGASGVLLLSLALRVFHRGEDIPGWDLVASVQGHFLASTEPFGDAVVETFWQSRHSWLPFPAFSVPYALIPGYLTIWWPWLYWTHVVVFLGFVLSLVLLRAAAGLRWRDGWVFLLGWTASPVLLSYSLSGMPWASGLLPHAIALWATMGPRGSAHGVWSVLLSLLATETAWHCYEVGRSVGVVFVVAAIVRGQARAPLRLAWLAIGTWSIVDTLVLHPTTNVKAFGGERLASDPTAILVAVQRLIDAFTAFQLDLPSVVLIGLLAFAGMRRDRVFVGLLLLVQIAAVLVLAIPTTGLTGDALRPRRFLLVEGYCLVAMACMVRDAGPTGRRVLAAALLAASLWQLQTTMAFVRKPREAEFLPMPFMYSPEGIGRVSPATAKHAARILGDVGRGRYVIVAYNLGCYPENLTNPAGLLERVYLTLGHRRFVRSVGVFGSTPCRYCCLPIRPLSELDGVLDAVAAGRLGPATVYRPTSCDPPRPDYVEAKTARESTRVYNTARARLPLVRLPDSDATADHLLVAETLSAGGATTPGERASD